MEKGLFSRSWWSFLAKGVLAIALGALLLAWPEATVRVLVYIFGIFAVIDGAVDLVRVVYLATRKEKWGILLAKGALGLLIGVIIISREGMALVAAVIVIAAWAILVGFVDIIDAIEMPPKSGRWLIAATGCLALVLGILLIAWPFSGVSMAVAVVGAYALASGSVLVVLAFVTLGLRKRVEKA